MKRKRSGALLFVAILFICLTPVIADEQIFVQLEAIPGESPDQTHTDWIDANGLETSIFLDQGVSGWPTKLQNIVFVKGTDKASVALQKALVAQSEITTAVIEICRPQQSGPLYCYLRIELDRLYVTSMSTAGSACTESTNCVPIQTERVELNYQIIRWIWTGDHGQVKEFTWDLTGGGA